MQSARWTDPGHAAIDASHKVHTPAQTCHASHGVVDECVASNRAKPLRPLKAAHTATPWRPHLSLHDRVYYTYCAQAARATAQTLTQE
eukprot:6482709-Amphidinium_carterae.2